MSIDPEGEIFADGLTEELSHVLASLGDLKVAGRTSSFYFKGRNEDLREIGETLGVAHVLEGSVRQSGNHLRITAQLINTADGFHLWSESYDREMSDIIDIQKDIAQAVALKLKSSSRDVGELSDLSNATISPEAYALYLKAVSLSPYGKTRDLAEAQALAEQVTEMAPDFAPSWNRLAAIHGRRLVYGDPEYDVSPHESLAISGEAVKRALALDPTSGEAYANLGGAAWVFERDIGKAAPLIEKALELDPWNLDIVSFAADFAKYIGRQDEALVLEELLVSRDPICYTCRANLASSYLYAHRFDDAEVQFQTLRSIGGGHDWTLGTIFLLKQQPELAREYFQRIEGIEQLRQLGEALALHDLGRTDESSQLLDQVAIETSDSDPLAIAQAFAYVGEVDRAFEWLEQALPAATLYLQTSFPHPLYDKLRDDLRWHDIMKRIGRAPEQLDEIPFSLDGARERLETPGITNKNWRETGQSNRQSMD
jgi:TolB-like protein